MWDSGDPNADSVKYKTFPCHVSLSLRNDNLNMSHVTVIIRGSKSQRRPVEFRISLMPMLYCRYFLCIMCIMTHIYYKGRRQNALAVAPISSTQLQLTYIGKSLSIYT